VRAGHERGHLLVARLNELGTLPVRGTLERAHQPVDAVAGVSVDAPDPPGGETVEKVVTYCLAHPVPVPFARFARAWAARLPIGLPDRRSGITGARKSSYSSLRASPSTTAASICARCVS